jgi:phage FluMu protein Com
VIPCRRLAPARTEIGMHHLKGPELANIDFAATSGWYLTVRCSNPRCGRLIAFQKSRFYGSDPNLRLAVTGKLSVECPHCKRLVRFQEEQIKRRNVVLTQ